MFANAFETVFEFAYAKKKKKKKKCSYVLSIRHYSGIVWTLFCQLLVHVIGAPRLKTCIHQCQ